eukprot:gb/GEZN01003634.1/.p1 GENE.gb/GEZN01003634.1/~~gb/GEZN01003634.1/.p1  ORF type:complete len:247 (-),score=35.79 gb/GEZN01003634.1/:970-1710(-)
MSQRWLLRSKDRESGLSHDFRLFSPQPLLGKFKLEWATVPNTLYNINSLNNTFTLYDNIGVATTYTITPQNYSGTTFAAALNTAFNGDVAVTYNSATLKLVFKNNLVGTRTLVSHFNAGGTVVMPYNVSASPPNVVQLGLPTSIGVHVKEARTTGFQTTGRDTYNVVDDNKVTVKVIKGTRANNGTLLIPFVSEYGTYACTASQGAFSSQFLHFQQPVRHLNISIQHDSNVLDLNGSEWEMFISQA